MACAGINPARLPPRARIRIRVRYLKPASNTGYDRRVALVPTDRHSSSEFGRYPKRRRARAQASRTNTSSALREDDPELFDGPSPHKSLSSAWEEWRAHWLTRSSSSESLTTVSNEIESRPMSSFPVASSTAHRSAPREMASRHSRKEERKGLKARRSSQRRRPNANRACSELAVKALEWERSKPARPKIDAEDLQSMSRGYVGYGCG
jgi:hypothetical protein